MKSSTPGFVPRPTRARARRQRSFALAAVTGLVTASGIATAPTAQADTVVTVADGETYTVSTKTILDGLVVEEGGIVTAPSGYDLSLTIDGVEQGQVFDSWYAVTSSIQPGTYSGGTVVLTPTVRYTGTIGGVTFPIRSGLYVDSNGVNTDQSVESSWLGGTGPGDTSVDGLVIDSNGDGFDGVWAQGTTYDLTNPTVTLDGNGRSDFVGSGAAIVGNGTGTTLTVDGADIDNTGVVRTGVVANGTANVVVKNSSIATHDGTLPEGYVSSVSLGYMLDAPWMLGVKGNVRATNLLGANTKAAYINSDLYSSGWGVLSVDTGSYTKMTAINSTVTTGESGYGTYAIGNANEQLLGTTFDVDDYGSIVTGSASGVVHFGDSDAASVAKLNTDRSLGLSETELAAIEEQPTRVASGRIGVMWHGAGNVVVDGGTTFDTVGPVFEDKGRNSTATIAVDGSEGADLDSEEGVLVQVMENDDPGPVATSTEAGTILANTGTYTQPTTDVSRTTSWDLTSTSVTSRTQVDLSDTSVKGDFYNGTRTAKNLVVNLTDTTVRGVISSSTTAHKNGVTTITADNWYDIGEVDNTVATPINNGVIVNLAGNSIWRVTGQSYLTKLVVGSDASVVGAGGKNVTMTVGGVETDIVPGMTYTGSYGSPIVVTVEDGDVDSTTDVDVEDVTYGEAANAQVTVADSDGYEASGDVTVSVDGTEVGTASLDDDGVAALALPTSLDAGEHTVTASYAGADGVAASDDSTDLTVAKADSATALSLSSSTVAEGEAATATATVSFGDDGDGTGSVDFLVDGTSVGTADLGSGSASVTLPSDLSVGDHAVTAQFGGSVNLNASQSASSTLTVSESTQASITAVAVSPDSSAYGRSRSARVTVTSDGSPATGSVTVSVDGSAVKTLSLDASGAASVALPTNLSVGTHSVIAAYAGAGATAGSSASTTFEVTKAASATKLKLAKSHVTKGSRVDATLKLKAAGLSPTGKVKVFDGDRLLGIYKVKSDGKVRVTLPRFTAGGKHKLRAVYLGTRRIAGSTSTKVTLHVVP